MLSSGVARAVQSCAPGFRSPIYQVRSGHQRGIFSGVTEDLHFGKSFDDFYWNLFVKACRIKYKKLAKIRMPLHFLLTNLGAKLVAVEVLYQKR